MGRRLAIFIWGGLGNTVMALPMINALRRGRQGEEILIVLPRLQYSALISQPRDGVRISSFSGNFSHALARLISFRPEMALSSLPYPRWRYGLSAWITGARTRIGDSEFPNRLLNILENTSWRARHFVERNLALLAPLGIADLDARFDMPIGGSESLKAEEFLGARCLSSFVAIHPGAGNPLRRWSLDNHRRLCQALRAKGRSMIVLAGPKETGLVAELLRGLDFTPPIGAGTLGELLPILARASALVAADSGLAHCAAALGVPTLALMGPSDENVYRPYGPRVRVLTNEIACRPCYRPGGRIRCPWERRLCLDIEVERVLAALEEMI